LYISDEQEYRRECRCGGSYKIFKNELEDSNVIQCDSCSLSLLLELEQNKIH